MRILLLSWYDVLDNVSRLLVAMMLVGLHHVRIHQDTGREVEEEVENFFSMMGGGVKEEEDVLPLKFSLNVS
jgi:hypothetical protein